MRRPDVQPAQSKGPIDSKTFRRGERLGSEAGGTAVVKTANAELDVVLIGHLAGDEEFPVNLEDAVAFHRIGGRIHIDVLCGVVGVGEDVPVLP